MILGAVAMFSVAIAIGIPILLLVYQSPNESEDEETTVAVPTPVNWGAFFYCSYFFAVAALLLAATAIAHLIGW
ncbi:hypothetical protein CL628_03305 [bacterium]|nr:hypothetical protein [bacterium]|tara:strand:- start:30 stop:251 length:222 start_codon:yes stop_codon:yes gene_type:complete